MNRRKDLLNALAEGKQCGALGLTKDEIRTVFQKLMSYYEMSDLETRDIHSRIFKTLYIDGGFKHYDSVAKMYYISSYTLDRYRQRYNRLAENLIKDKIAKQKNFYIRSEQQ